ESAINLFDKKLYGLVVARAGLIDFMDNFTDSADSKSGGYMCSILHILCRSEREVEILRETYEELTDELRSDIIVIVTRVTADTEVIVYGGGKIDTSGKRKSSKQRYPKGKQGSWKDSRDLQVGSRGPRGPELGSRGPRGRELDVIVVGAGRPGSGGRGGAYRG